MNELTEAAERNTEGTESSEVDSFIQQLSNASLAHSFEHLKAMINRDADYAWSWHCNIAMSHYDAMIAAGYTHHRSIHKTSNAGAARFMRLAFGVDTTTYLHYAETQRG
jgi:hypothetical protein